MQPEGNRGLHSSTFQRNVQSTSCGMYQYQKRLKLSSEVDEWKPLD
jgi:hypothetical protein